MTKPKRDRVQQAMDGIRNPGKPKRYVIRYIADGSEDGSPTWGIWDTQGDPTGFIEAGYTKQGAIYAANFHNYQYEEKGRSA